MENAIFIGDLARDVDRNQICSLLHRLNVHRNVQPSDIYVHKRAGINGYTYAFVHLNNESQMYYVLKVLKDRSNRNIISNSGIVKEGCHSVSVAKKRSNTTNQTNHAQQAGPRPQQGINHTLNVKPPNIHIPFNNSNEKTYTIGESIGSERRDREFKIGGEFFMQRTLEENVSKYTCGFLNSSGGTLMVGVNDDGLVEGVEIDHHEEDGYRLRIDYTIKKIHPTVMPEDYAVDFISVVDRFGKNIGERKVLEIKVNMIEDKENLYANGAGKVFVRRDGSIQEWTATQIQHWHQQKKKKEREEKEHLQSMLNNENKESHQVLSALKDLQNSKGLEEKLEREKQVKAQMERDILQAEEKEKELQRELQSMAQKRENLEKVVMEQTITIERLQKKSKTCLIL